MRYLILDDNKIWSFVLQLCLAGKENRVKELKMSGRDWPNCWAGIQHVGDL